MIHSYPRIYNLGHAEVNDILREPVIIQEKIDGSQFSFGLVDGVLQARSKGQQIDMDAPDKMFEKAVEYIKSIKDKLYPGWVYRGEYLQKPKHNCLVYDRTPNNNIIIFDINTNLEQYMIYSDVMVYSTDLLQLEVVPVLYEGMLENMDKLKELLETTSVLGGQKIEGVVIKPLNYDKFGKDKKCLMAKFVSEAYKEVHSADWKDRNPKSRDIITMLGLEYKTPARWNKAIQHLAERGELENSPRDIGKLLQEINVDILKECEEEIKDKLFKWAWKDLSRILIQGFPQYYKELLAKEAFESGKKVDNAVH